MTSYTSFDQTPELRITDEPRMNYYLNAINADKNNSLEAD